MALFVCVVPSGSCRCVLAGEGGIQSPTSAPAASSMKRAKRSLFARVCGTVRTAKPWPLSALFTREITPTVPVPPPVVVGLKTSGGGGGGTSGTGVSVSATTYHSDGAGPLRHSTYLELFGGVSSVNVWPCSYHSPSVP